MEHDLSIILPAQNEKDNLPFVLDELFDVINKINLNTEYILIKNANDNSCDKLSELQKNQIKIVNQKIPGFGSAIKEGLTKISSKKTIIYLTDGSMNPNDIFKIYNYLDTYDFIFCSRYENNAHSDDDTNLTFVGNKIFSLIGKYFFGLKITDILYTYFGLNSKYVNKLNLSSNDFGICVELPIKVHRLKFNYRSIPSNERKRLSGEKNVSEFRDGFKILIKMILLFLKR
tara:strand:+ start:13210 stop:13899 length:690 start_codon:yes stop_codon:yes gene_type:complete